MGQHKKADLQPVHTLGWTEAIVKKYILDAIAQLEQKLEVEITCVAASVELDPHLCPLMSCPLKISSFDAG
jgi:hypothetical protein